LKKLAIGELSAKYSETGYSGISRIKMEQTDNYGKLPQIKDIILEDI
jgi:hypothetical protein